MFASVLGLMTRVGRGRSGPEQRPLTGKTARHCCVALGGPGPAVDNHWTVVGGQLTAVVGQPTPLGRQPTSQSSRERSAGSAVSYEREVACFFHRFSRNVTRSVNRSPENWGGVGSGTRLNPHGPWFPYAPKAPEESCVGTGLPKDVIEGLTTIGGVWGLTAGAGGGGRFLAVGDAMRTNSCALAALSWLRKGLFRSSDDPPICLGHALQTLMRVVREDLPLFGASAPLGAWRSECPWWRGHKACGSPLGLASPPPPLWDED